MTAQKIYGTEQSTGKRGTFAPKNSNAMNWNRLKIWLIAGCVLVFLLYLGHAIWLNRRFEKDGVAAMGIVTRVYSKIESHSERGSSYRTQRRVKRKIYYLDYRFTVGGRDFVAFPAAGSRSRGYPQRRFDFDLLSARQSGAQPSGFRRGGRAYREAERMPALRPGTCFRRGAMFFPIFA